MSFAVASAAFLIGAAVSAFLAALFVRRSTAKLGPGQPTSVPMTPAARLAPRVLGALDVGVVVLDRDETAIFANPVARRMRVVDADRLALRAMNEFEVN